MLKKDNPITLYPDGSLKEGTLEKDVTIDTYLFKKGSGIKLYQNGTVKRAFLHSKRSYYIRGHTVTFCKGKYIDLGSNRNALSGILYSDTKFLIKGKGVLLKAQANPWGFADIRFYGDGSIEGGYIAQETKLYANNRWMTFIPHFRFEGQPYHFYRDGNVRSGFLKEGEALKFMNPFTKQWSKLIIPANALVSLHKNGEVKRINFYINNIIKKSIKTENSMVPISTSTVIEFHSNGVISDCYFTKEVKINGIWIRWNAKFYPDMKIRSTHLARETIFAIKDTSRKGFHVDFKIETGYEHKVKQKFYNNRTIVLPSNTIIKFFKDGSVKKASNCTDISIGKKNIKNYGWLFFKKGEIVPADDKAIK